MSSYELVYQKLRENILNGHYKHGDELRETAVGKEIGVSRTPGQAVVLYEDGYVLGGGTII